MKRKSFLLTALAAGLILSSLVSPAYGYFTANTQAEGGLVIEPIETHPEEKIVAGEKQVTIHNEEKAAPVYVRARGFSGDDSDLSYSAESGWTDGNDGWWYYDPILEAGTQTSVLIANISKVIPAEAEVGDNFNIVVVYEAIRAMDGVDGAKATFAAYLAQEGENQ